MLVNRISVIGGGLMGTGIAHVSALGGFETIIVDISNEILKKCHEQIKENIQKGVQLGKIKKEEMDLALARLKLEVNLKRGVEDADMVIEAAPEVPRLKLDLFSKMDEICKKETVFATNTSALSITEMAAATRRAPKVIGMHFFNPVHKMKLIEIIRGLETDDVTVRIAEKVAKRMGKESVCVSESPGFVTTRINALIGNEAFYILQEGIASAQDIDKALKMGLNHPMGPFELVDFVGLDTRLSVLNYLYERLGERYRPCPLMIKYVKAGRLGRKAGKGVYDYTSESERR